MGSPYEIDLGGMTILAREFKSGSTKAGRSATTSHVTAGGSTLTLTRADHLGRIIKLDTASGTVITLPASSGSGDTYRFLITTTVTSNSHIIKVANATDTMVGILSINSAAVGANSTATDIAGSTDDTITMNGSTTGGVAGSWIEATDIVSGTWFIRGQVASTGTAASGQFSATVS